MSRTDAVQREQKQRDEGYGDSRKWYLDSDLMDKIGVQQFKAKVGTNFLDLIPPTDTEVYFGVPIFVHYNLGPNSSDAYLCPNMMKDVLQKRASVMKEEKLKERLIAIIEGIPKRCPACERRDQLKAAEADEDVVKALTCFPPRYLFMAVDVSSPDEEKKGPQIYDAPKTVNDEVLGLSRDRRTGEVIDITDLDKGKTLIFDRKGKGAHDTRYSAFELENRDPIPDKWLDVPEIEEFLHFGTEEEMEESLGASVRREESEASQDEDRTPRRRSRSTESQEKDTEGAEDTGSRRRRGGSDEQPAEEKSAGGDEKPAARRRRIPRDKDAEPESKESDEKPADEKVDEDTTKARLRERLARRRKE